MFTEDLTGELLNILLNKNDSALINNKNPRLAKWLLDATPLEVGTRAGKIIK